MANRNNNNQSYHDRIIEIASNGLRNNFRVYTNPGTQHNTRVGSHYPDIILTPQDNNNIQFIIEVETGDSVNAHEAVNQWLPYSKIGGTFYLLIPQEKRALAETLCKQYSISVKYATYWVDESKFLQINYE